MLLVDHVLISSKSIESRASYLVLVFQTAMAHRNPALETLYCDGNTINVQNDVLTQEIYNVCHINECGVGFEIQSNLNTSSI